MLSYKSNFFTEIEVKVLLCTMNVGQGLNSICNAVAAKLTEMNIQNQVFNVFETAKDREKFNTITYYRLAKVIPNLLRYFQTKSANYNRDLSKKPNPVFLQKEINILTTVLQEKIESEKFDVIFTPVSSVAITANMLKQQGKIDCKIVYCIPDFNLPTYMELCRGVDKIITNCDENNQNLIKYNFKKETLAQLGLPINEKFFENTDRKILREKFGLFENDFVVLITSGGAGFGKTSKIIKRLSKKLKNIKFVVVNGKNTKEKQKIDFLIQKYDLDNVLNFGFCTNMNELMGISDVILTKTGAATMCECYAKKLPIVTMKQVLYPESDNIKHLLKYNAAVECKDLKELEDTLEKIFLKELDINKIEDNYQKLFERNSSKIIAEMMAKMVE